MKQYLLSSILALIVLFNGCKKKEDIFIPDKEPTEVKLPSMDVVASKHSDISIGETVMLTIHINAVEGTKLVSLRVRENNPSGGNFSLFNGFANGTTPDTFFDVTSSVISFKYVYPNTRSTTLGFWLKDSKGNVKIQSITLTSREFNGAIHENDSNYKDITITEQQEALAIFLTGTWCWACGSQGIGAFQEILNFNKEKVNGISIQLNDNLLGTKTALESNLNKIFTHNATPNYWVNKNFYSNSMFNFQSNVKKIIGSSEIPIVSIGLSTTLMGNKLSIKSKVKFSKEIQNSDYKISFFIVEDNIDEQQMYIQSPSTKRLETHHNILRAIANGNSIDHFGNQVNIPDSKIKSGDFFGNISETFINPTWDTKNLKVVAIVWEVKGNRVLSIANSNTISVQ